MALNGSTSTAYLIGLRQNMEYRPRTTTDLDGKVGYPRAGLERRRQLDLAVQPAAAESPRRATGSMACRLLAAFQGRPPRSGRDVFSGVGGEVGVGVEHAVALRGGHGRLQTPSEVDCDCPRGREEVERLCVCRREGHYQRYGGSPRVAQLNHRRRLEA